MTEEPLRITELRTDALTPYARNSRTHSNEQIRQIADSIQEFGFVNPVLIDENCSIIAGHGRVLAALLLERRTVPTIILEGLSDEQRRAYVIADNKIAQNAGWDENMLRLELQDLQIEEYPLEVIGLSVDEISEVLYVGNRMEQNEDDLDQSEEWVGMPEFDNADLRPWKVIRVGFASAADMEAFAEKIGQPVTEKTRSILFPENEREKFTHIRYEQDDES